jgi:hypothetical protein
MPMPEIEQFCGSIKKGMPTAQTELIGRQLRIYFIGIT